MDTKNFYGRVLGVFVFTGLVVSLFMLFSNARFHIGDRAIASETKKEVFYKCTREKEMRWMRINFLKNGKCKTTYSKSGNATEVATAKSYKNCEDILNNVKINLEKGGFKCEEKVLLGAIDLDTEN